MKKIYLLALAVIGFSANSFAQSTTTASTTATIITPISVSKTNDMNFGLIATNGLAGTASLDYANAVTGGGGVSVVTGGIPKTAQFAVIGETNNTFSISVPTGSITLTGTTAGVTVSNFVADLGPTGTLASGTKSFFVKAILNVPASVVAGSYFNTAGLSVTVNYN